MKLPEGLPPLPPNTYYGGQLKDHEGEVSGYIFEMGLESWTHFLKGLIGMKDFPNEGSANWHIALPLPEEDEYDKADKIRESQKARIRRDSGKPEEDAIRTKQMGQVYIASDGERSAIGATSGDARQAVKDMQEDAKPEGGMSAQPRETSMTECDECGKPLDAIDAEELHGTCMDCEAKHYVTPCLVQPSETPLTDSVQYLTSRGDYVSVDFTRQLETSLTTVRAEVEDLHAEIDRLKECLAYLAECTAATLEHAPRSTSQRERTRLANICTITAGYLEGDHVVRNGYYPLDLEEKISRAVERCRNAARVTGKQ